MGIFGRSGALIKRLQYPPWGGSPHIATVNAIPHPQKTKFQKKLHLVSICAILSACKNQKVIQHL